MINHQNNTDKWNPTQYEKFKKERSQPFFDLLTLLKKDTYEEGIDLGCGTGELTKFFAEKFKIQKITGLDSSEEMLKKSNEFESSNLKFVKGNIEAFTQNQKFDVIISNAAIQWCPDHKNILSNIVAALRSNGELAIQMPYNFDYTTHTLAEEVVAQLFPQTTLRGNPMLSLQEYAKTLYNLGLTDLNCFIKVYVHELTSKQDVYEWVRGTLLTHYQGQLSEEEFGSFCKHYRTKLERQLPDDKPFFYPFKRIFLYGKKK